MMKQVIKDCIVCKLNRNRFPIWQSEAVSKAPPSRPFEVIQCDYLVARGVKIFCIVCCYSGYMWMRFKNECFKGALEGIREFILTVGEGLPPAIIYSDSASYFQKLKRHFVESEVILSAANAPWSHGLIGAQQSNRSTNNEESYSQKSSGPHSFATDKQHS